VVIARTTDFNVKKLDTSLTWGICASYSSQKAQHYPTGHRNSKHNFFFAEEAEFKSTVYIYCKNRDSVVGITNAYGLDDQGV
jgi:hypothetical protein